MTFSKLGTDIQTGHIIELPKASRPQGLYIIGIQGTGKSGLIENLIMQDIKQQIGVCVLDPHGELIDHVIARLPDKQAEDKVILLDLNDYQHPFGINIFTCSDLTNPFEVQKTIDKVEHIFEKLLGVSSETPMILEYLVKCTHTLIANPGYTMADIPLLLADSRCRQKLVANVTDTDVRLFWQRFDQMKITEQHQETSSTSRRVGRFLQPLSRLIVGQAETTIDLQQIMQEEKILLVKLSTQVPSVAELIGSVIIALFLNAAPLRPVNKRKQFHLYADEFQRFATEDFATLLEEARKFGIATTIAHQNRSQLDADNKQLETNLKDRSRSVGNLVVFRVNSRDADDLAGEFDVTPEEAWEEELEEEWVEVTKEEWFERVEEDVPDAENAVITYKRDVVGHLLHQGHENPSLEQFVTKYLQKINNATHEYAVAINGLIGTDFGKSAKDSTEHYNNYSNHVYSSFRNYVGKAKYHEGNYSPNVEAEIAKDSYRWTHDNYGSYWYNPLAVQNDLHNLNSLLYDAMRGKLADEAIELRLLQVLQGGEHTGLSAFLGCDTYVTVNSGLLNPTAQAAFTHVLAFVRDYYDYVEKLPNRLGLPQAEQTKHYEYLRNWCIRELHPWLEQLFSNYDNAYDLNIKTKVYEAEQNRYRWFKESLLTAIAGLQQDPIQTRESGQYQPRTNKHITYLTHPRETITHPRVAIMHPQRTYADMVNDIANQLSSLPNYTARTRIFVKGQTVEHTLKTFEPEKGLYGKPLQERIARIQARNIQEGMLRNRADVEAEITNRQTGCSSGSAPAQPQKPQQPRHARQVPMQGNCPNCGKPNPTGSQFCSQCGSPI